MSTCNGRCYADHQGQDHDEWMGEVKTEPPPMRYVLEVFSGQRSIYRAYFSATESTAPSNAASKTWPTHASVSQVVVRPVYGDETEIPLGASYEAQREADAIKMVAEARARNVPTFDEQRVNELVTKAYSQGFEAGMLGQRHFDAAKRSGTMPPLDLEGREHR